MSTTDIDMARLRTHTVEVAGIAATHGWALPAEYGQMNGVRREAIHLRNEPPPAATIPTDPDKVAAWVTDQAAERLAHRERIAVATQLSDDAERESMRQALSQVPEFIQRLCAKFAEHADDFQRLLTTAPMEVDSTTSTKQFALHQELLRASDWLTTCARHRGQLALITGEADDIGRNALWLVIDPREDVMLSEIVRLTSEYRDRLPSTRHDWQEVARIGLDLAAQDAVPYRTERFGSAQYAAGLATPDGGMHDRTLAQALEVAAR